MNLMTDSLPYTISTSSFTFPKNNTSYDYTSIPQVQYNDCECEPDDDPTEIPPLAAACQTGGGHGLTCKYLNGPANAAVFQINVEPDVDTSVQLQVCEKQACELEINLVCTAYRGCYWSQCRP